MILTNSRYKSGFRIAKKHKTILILLVLLVFFRLFSLNASVVERYYTYGIYPFISSFLRNLIGWIPFSVGDLLYLTAAIYLVLKIVKYIRLISKKNFKHHFTAAWLEKLVCRILSVYLIFNLFWGFNYDRLGIASQLKLNVGIYTTRDLITLAGTLSSRLDSLAKDVDSIRRQSLDRSDNLLSKGIDAFETVKGKYAFLEYKNPSVKPSLYNSIGNLIGFTGYYNPFSAEAQIKTDIPVFMKPFVLAHEIGHQLGYGKENEANFVGYLACRHSGDINFRYSAYFEMTLYALYDLRRRDSTAAAAIKLHWPARVKNDYHTYQEYLIKSRNPIEPFMMRFYDQFLKLNNQPEGMLTYNEVIAWLIAYMKIYGIENI